MLNISIKAKLYSLLFIVIGILTISSLMTYRSIIPIQDKWSFYLDNVAQREVLLMNIKAQFGFGGTIHNFKNYILRGNNKYYDRLDNNFKQLSQAINRYQTLSGISSAENQAIQNIQSVVNAYKTQSKIAYKLITEGKTPKQVDHIVKVNDNPAFIAFEILDKAYKNLTDDASIGLSQDIENIISSTLIGSVSLIIIITTSIWLISSIIVRRLDNVRQTLHDIEGNNDIGIRLSTSRNDEISDVFCSLNHLLDSFTNMIKSIISASVEVGIESSNQAAIVEKTVKGIHQQHKKINLVTTSMQRMSETVQNVSINADQAVAAAELATQGIAEGNQQMSQMISTMDELNHSIESAGQSISELETESQQISTVLEVIHGISEQTNLLALNAAIEAARAGEQGRGFAVVADEVRALAARTKDSTDEIRQMIEGLQNRVQTTVTVMDISRQKTNESADQAKKTGITLDGVSNDIAGMSSVMQQIASTSSEQFEVSMQMSQYINAISEVAINTAEYADATLIATGHIGEKTEALREAATQFKINDNISQLEQAKAAHLAWRSKLMSHLSGALEIDSHKLSSHHDCSLGQWYYHDGLQQFSHIPEMKELEHPHEQIHQVIHKVVQQKAAGNTNQAMQEFEKITPLSQQLVDIIDRIIAKI